MGCNHMDSADKIHPHSYPDCLWPNVRTKSLLHSNLIATAGLMIATGFGWLPLSPIGHKKAQILSLFAHSSMENDTGTSRGREA